MVVTVLPSKAATGVTQDHRALPFTCTVQEPHAPTPQPYFVPVMLSSSRITQSKGVALSPSNVTVFELTLNDTMSLHLPLTVIKLMTHPVDNDALQCDEPFISCDEPTRTCTTHLQRPS